MAVKTEAGASQYSSGTKLWMLRALLALGRRRKPTTISACAPAR